jgi:tetratricopeptide (TPR) repeat protein
MMKRSNSFTKRIDLDPRFYYTHWNLAEALEMKGNMREALVEYKKAVELDDDPSFSLCSAKLTQKWASGMKH